MQGAVRRRRLSLRFAVVLLVAALGGATSMAGTGCAASGASQGASQRPSVVLVLSDDQRWDTLWAMPVVQEALAANGVTFSRAFTVNPLCCPSRVSLLTGRYSHSTGVYNNSGPHGSWSDFHDATTLATVLHKRGYTTALIGKYVNTYGENGGQRGYIPPGWDRWLTFRGGTKYYDYELADQRKVVHHGHRPSDYSTTVFTRAAVDFIRTAPRPFFLLLSPFAPHEPATAPPGMEDSFADLPWWKPPSYNEQDRSDKPAYVRNLPKLTSRQMQRTVEFRRAQLQATLGVDWGVRSLLLALDRRHMLGATLIVYMSDNGVAWGEHPFIAARKLVPYEEPIRVPLVIRYDTLLRREATIDDRLVLNIDIAPTIAELAGTKLPGAEGKSLVPLLTPGGDDHWRRDFLVEHLRGEPQPDVPTYCAVRGVRFKYVLYQTGEQELYDLRRDPHELVNLARDPGYKALREQLRNRLSELCVPRPPGYTQLGRAPS